jgi:phage regulator Rha-like protein
MSISALVAKKQTIVKDNGKFNIQTDNESLEIAEHTGKRHDNVLRTIGSR